MKLLKSFFAVMMVPLTLVSLLGGLFLLHKAWKFMTLPTSEGIDYTLQEFFDAL